MRHAGNSIAQRFTNYLAHAHARRIARTRFDRSCRQIVAATHKQPARRRHLVAQTNSNGRRLGRWQLQCSDRVVGAQPAMAMPTQHRTTHRVGRTTGRRRAVFPVWANRFCAWHWRKTTSHSRSSATLCLGAPR